MNPYNYEITIHHIKNKNSSKNHQEEIDESEHEEEDHFSDHLNSLIDFMNSYCHE
jgi:hypothetical protein